MPRSDYSGIAHRKVRHGGFRVVLVPVFAEHLDEVSALVGVDLEVAEFDAFDHRPTPIPPVSERGIDPFSKTDIGMK